MLVSRIFFVAFIAWVCSEILLQIVTRTRNRSETHDQGSLRILLLVISVSITFGMTYAARHRPTMGGTWLRWLALAIFTLGIAIRWTAILQLGRSFSANVAIHATQTLHRSGLFALVRHPSYTGMLLIFIGLGIWTRNWVTLAIILVPCTIALFYRINVEEAALRGAFGSDYESYTRTTKRLLPGLF